jgi:putative transposase
MGRKYKFHENDSLYLVSFATVNWVDVFVRRVYCDIVIDSLKYCIDNKGLELYAWFIMSSHVHLIISAEKGNLSDIIRDLKRHTSKTILRPIEENCKRAEENGCFGCLNAPVSTILITRFTSSGNKTITQ